MTPLGHQVTNRLEGFRYLDPDTALRGRLGLEDNAARAAEIKRIRILDGARLSFETTYVGEALAQKLTSADLATQEIFKLIEERSAVRIDHANVAVDAMLADEETRTALGSRRAVPYFGSSGTYSTPKHAPSCSSSSTFVATHSSTVCVSTVNARQST